MRIRIASLSVLAGLVLLSTELIRYITACDLQRQEPTTPLRGLPVITGLLAAGAASGAGGVAVMTRLSRPVLMVLIGMVLLGSTGVLYLHACDGRRQEQAGLDERWTNVAHRASQHSTGVTGSASCLHSVAGPAHGLRPAGRRRRAVWWGPGSPHAPTGLSPASA